jgi:hypothetical protein
MSGGVQAADARTVFAPAGVAHAFINPQDSGLRKAGDFIRDSVASRDSEYKF